LFLFAAVNAFLVAIWALTSGSLERLQQIVRNPSLATATDFWPIWPILAWGTLLIIHAGIVHAGEAVDDEGDLVGRVINLASRVTDEAKPGEILVTEPVADQLVGKLELEDKGLRPLKGVSQPRHLLAVKWSEAPEPQT
jgi:class 3 adenylate cyclase